MVPLKRKIGANQLAMIFAHEPIADAVVDDLSLMAHDMTLTHFCVSVRDWLNIPYQGHWIGLVLWLIWSTNF
ncbi:hypothetical protein TNCV_3577521 [Trichonephila clavipes]|uniref:Uncharacterized protein n=1 Tax=Trichonephila clavipes TaxID=2585209 RepID=A0A8X6V1N9_TRICX|nr:hypothetical protein TNCV_3577521 [Trichonephila clavipes]